MRLSFPRKKPEFNLILDIGTESVKAILYQKKEGKRMILGTSLEYFDEFGAWGGFFSSGNGNIAEAAIMRAAEKAVRTVVEQMEKGVSGELYVTLPPVLLHARIVTMVFERKEIHKHISNTEAEEILSSGEREGKQTIQKMAQGLYGISPQEFTFLVFKPISFSIDGYRVSSLRNFNGKRITWSALAVIARKQVLPKSDFFQALRGLAGDFRVHFSLLNIVSLAESFVQLAPLLEDGIFIDIGGEETQVFVVQQKSLVFTFDFPMGASHWERIIAADLGIREQEVGELLERYSAGMLTHEVGARLKGLMRAPVSQWLDALKKGIEKENLAVVPLFFIFGGGSLLPDLGELLGTADWGNILPAGSPRVTQLSLIDLPHLEYTEKRSINPQYTPSFLLCYYDAAQKKDF